MAVRPLDIVFEAILIKLPEFGPDQKNRQNNFKRPLQLEIEVVTLPQDVTPSDVTRSASW